MELKNRRDYRAWLMDCHAAIAMAFYRCFTNDDMGDIMIKELDFDTDPKHFPRVWESGEAQDKITLTINDNHFDYDGADIDAIVNKHVYLSMIDCGVDVAMFIIGDGKL